MRDVAPNVAFMIAQRAPDVDEPGPGDSSLKVM